MGTGSTVFSAAHATPTIERIGRVTGYKESRGTQGRGSRVKNNTTPIRHASRQTGFAKIRDKKKHGYAKTYNYENVSTLLRIGTQFRHHTVIRKDEGM